MYVRVAGQTRLKVTESGGWGCWLEDTKVPPRLLLALQLLDKRCGGLGSSKQGILRSTYNEPMIYDVADWLVFYIFLFWLCLKFKQIFIHHQSQPLEPCQEEWQHNGHVCIWCTRLGIHIFVLLFNKIVLY